ncbi:MAG: peptidase C69 [Candidatus Muiribacterium halophilum]|uniref:Peptidase C69 n=1 Tax=Muiribacterium halophilum TaxID=2053465 RepID=A0A2N5ZGD5_MUIH1|nr:MAG: peptidase C69 [Candidatus Muirbacterium halophilum]
MYKVCDFIIDLCEKGKASYADARIVEMNYESLTVKKGELSGIENSISKGVGIRVIVNGAWGFASTNDLSEKSLRKNVELAISIGKASSHLIKQKVRLTEDKVYQDTWSSPYILDPFNVTWEDKVGLLMDCDRILSQDKKIVDSKAYMSFSKEVQWFVSSEGARIKQQILRSGGGMSAIASNGNEFQRRTYPASFGQYYQGGYEVIQGFKLLENAENTRKEAIALLDAPQCPSGKKDLILHGEQLALQIHESIGHATELDRVLGLEANFAGRSFVTLEKKGKFKYGSKLMNIVADPTCPMGLGTYGYDDDGVRAERFHVIKDGVFENYLGNREFAHTVNETHSRACNRAQGWMHIPIVRMPNLSLMPGEGTLEEIIADTKDGLIVDTVKSWSIDQYRYNFQFGMEAGWVIKDGSISHMVKNPTYQGITPEFWGSMDRVAGFSEWKLNGVPNCGKGQPMQVAEMSHGCSPARFKKVEIGIMR